MSSSNPFEPRRRARRRALQAIYQWQLNNDTPAAIIAQFTEEQNFDGVDEEYFKALVTEIVSHKEAIDELIAPALERVDASLDQMERAVLRLGVNELMNHPEVPYRVIIDEAIELSHRFGSENAHTFINGVMDRVANVLRATEIAHT